MAADLVHGEGGGRRATVARDVISKEDLVVASEEDWSRRRRCTGILGREK